MQVARRVAPEKPAAGRVSALSMYELPPAEPISVSEFEEFAYDRLRRAAATPERHALTTNHVDACCPPRRIPNAQPPVSQS